jgi:hypothetical protein
MRLIVKLLILGVAVLLGLWLGVSGDVVAGGAAVLGGLLALHP